MRNEVALDLYWLRALHDDLRLNKDQMFVGRPPASPQTTELIYAENISNPTRQLLDLLLFCEQLVINDTLLVDKQALLFSQLQIPDKLRLLIEPRSVPVAVYETAAQASLDRMGQLEEFGKRSPLIGHLVADLAKFEGTIFSDADDKSFFDSLSSSNLVHFAVSDGKNTFARTMFYLSFAEHFGAVTFLGRDKRDWLSRINAALAPTVHEAIENLFDDALKSEIRKQMEPTKIALPALPEFILRTALDRSIGLIDAAISIRQSNEASGYRRLLSEFKHWSSRGRPGAVEADKAFIELSRVAQSWQKYCDPKEQITRSRRTLDLSKLPYHIGDVLKFGGMEKIEVKDIILTKPPAFLAFISQWYS